MPISLGRSNTTIKEEKPKLKRSSTLSSRMKSFGSKLVRSSSYRISHQNTKVDSTIPIPALPSSDSSLKSSTDDSEEEQVVTPTSCTFPLHDDDKHTMVTPSSYVNHITAAVSVSPELQSSKTNELADKTDEEEEDFASCSTDHTFFAEEIKETPISTVSLVRYHVASAFKQIDQEIEQEFDLSYQQMIESIYASPRYVL
ncbi:hypothetical protein BD560DRAFT_402269 [Blakeslea trispora]|nr:hypothetical protein BD560DRAFT_402269 [Blakeslea trispora]